MNRCPTCGSASERYVRLPTWIEIVCGWCGELLHGIEAEPIAEGVARDEVA